MEEAKVVVAVERLRCGGSAKLGPARVVSGEPHVLAFHTDRDFATLAKSLAEDGYGFEVKVENRWVSMLEWYGDQGPEERAG